VQHLRRLSGGLAGFRGDCRDLLTGNTRDCQESSNLAQHLSNRTVVTCVTAHADGTGFHDNPPDFNGIQVGPLAAWALMTAASDWLLLGR